MNPCSVVGYRTVGGTSVSVGDPQVMKFLIPQRKWRTLMMDLTVKTLVRMDRQ